MTDATGMNGTEAGGGGGMREAPRIPGFQITNFKNSTSLADVWGALQLSLDRNVEIWILRREIAGDAAIAENYEEVARAVSKIKHPNFVQIIDISKTEEGIPFTVFEEIDGVPLSTKLVREGRIDQKIAATIIIGIANVLDSAWKQSGFVHRNIKPDTVYLARGAGVKITNFNSATLVKAGSNPLAYDGGFVIGTPNYQAPEQIECRRSIDFHADMYSAGALFYEMVTGQAPFHEEEDPREVMELQRTGTLPNPRELDKSIKPGFVYIMQKMMAKAPEERYTWWQDLVEDLQRVIDGRPPYPQSAGTYSAPRSTIGIMPGDVSPGAASANGRGQKRAVGGGSGQYRSAVSNGAPARTLSQRVADTQQSEGPGCLAILMSLLLIVAAVVLTGVMRIKDLEEKDEERQDLQTNFTAHVEDMYSPGDYAGPNPDDDAAPLDTSADVESGLESPPETATAGETVSEEPAASEPPTSEEPAAAPPTQREIVADIYAQFMAKDFAEAKKYVRERLLKAREDGGYDAAECAAIARAFDEAASYSDLVGGSLARGGVRRDITIGGRNISIAPKIYANGEVVGTITMPDGKVYENARLKVSEMSPREMYDTVQSGAMPTGRPSLLALAFLALKVDEPVRFISTVENNNLDGLKPFLEFSQKK